ncbi:MAG: AAC(3) family N-acetyltransferase [Alphaproteobacteria bacterium]|nr:AAC(3) family N-acetyltransferase [Alphaproteobacteria bacterium]
MNQHITALAKQWNASGIEAGDIVLLHGRIGPTIQRNAPAFSLTPQLILASFLKAIGEEGTLLLPLFNFDFCSGKAFDIRHTPSQMGALTEAARHHPHAIRTGHPVYSFAVIGKQRAVFENLANIYAYGGDSPFALLHNMDGKIAVLDVPDQHSMTFYHYVEETLQVPYRHDKFFTGNYTNSHGHTAPARFQIYVRDLAQGVITRVSPMEALLWQERCYQGHPPMQGYGLRSIRAALIFDKSEQIIHEGKAKEFLYTTEESE